MIQPSIQLTLEQKLRTIERIRLCIADLRALDVYSIYNKSDYLATITPLESRIDILLRQLFKYPSAGYFKTIGVNRLNRSQYDPNKTERSDQWVSIQEGTIKGIVNATTVFERILVDLEEECRDYVEPADLSLEIPVLTKKIFVVHGHDEGAREGAARFLEKIGLEAIILREQPNRGRTVIEKFVDCAQEVGFAVVLLTPDDLGSVAGDGAQMSRARQNVIFELGYFVGSLGRGRACLLRKGKVEIPSDLYGVVYSDMDGADGWKIALARELKAAGFEFDASKVLG